MEEIFFCPNCMAKTAPADGKCPVCGRNVNIQNALHQLPVNTILNGRYIVGKVLGAGGFGITYIGYDLKLDGKVAIKEYYPSGAANRSQSLTVLPTTDVKGNPFEVGKDRFLKEARTLSEFVGEGNIVTLRDYFEENGTAYIVMEYLEGEDLSHYAKEHGVFTIDDALDLLEPAMLALDKVHKKGLIHRDISPSNIMVMSDGRVKVLDFGSARLQNASGELSLSVMLKPGYAPAEQYSTHGEQGSWTDVYAMSATIYKLITGKTPPPSTDRILDDTIELPPSLGVKITPEQEAALMRGLALRVQDRTQTMAELAKGLREGLPVPDKKRERKGKTKKSAKPKKKLFIIAAAVLAVLAVCLTVPKTKNNADENNIKDVQDTHLAELAAAREALAPYNQTMITSGDNHTVYLKKDGTVAAVGEDYYGQCDVSDWMDIIAVSADGTHTVGLKSDGTVAAVGSNLSGQCNVNDWTDIVSISAGDSYTVGLKADGTVVASGDNYYGQCDVSDWTDIVAISAGRDITVGLRLDGSVISVGNNAGVKGGVDDWKNIIAVSVGDKHIVGLKADGTVAAVGNKFDGQCSVSDWVDIVAVSAGSNYTVGLKANGSVVAVGENRLGECEARGWTDVAAVCAGYRHTVGLKSDGTLVAVGNNSNGQCDVSGLPNSVAKSVVSTASIAELAAARAELACYEEKTICASYDFTVAVRTTGKVIASGTNAYGQCDVDDWIDITAVSAGVLHTVGLKTDGTVVAAGSNEKGQCDVSGWRNITAVSACGTHTVGLRSDGIVLAVGNNRSGQCDVGDWTDIVAISAGGIHTVGLKADGTVVAAGDNGYGQCDVSEWADIVAVSAGTYHTVGLKNDGTVVAVGSNTNDKCDVSDWTDIVAVSAGGSFTVGLKSDGTALITNDPTTFGWNDITEWWGVTAVSAGNDYTVGLKNDGTVVSSKWSYDWSHIKLP